MSPGAAIAIAAGGTLLMAAGITWMVVSFNRSYKRAEKAALERLRAELPKRGWTFAERDDSIAELWNRLHSAAYRPDPFRPFARRPMARGARDVITGIHRGRPFLAAEVDSSFRDGSQVVQCIWVRVPRFCPNLNVRKAPAISTTVNTALGWYVRSGIPDFDRDFEISSDDEAFLSAVINPVLAQFVLADERKFTGFHFIGDQFTVYDAVSDHRDPAELIPALDLRCDLLDRIPPAAWA